MCTVRAQRGHSAHMTRRNWGFLLQLAIFLPIQTILHPHNVGQPDVSPHPQHKRCQCTQPQQRHMQKKARTKFVLNSKCERRTHLRLAYVQDMHPSTWRPHPTSFRLCTATWRYFLLPDGISVLPADEEDESELSALTVEPLDMYWANLKTDRFQAARLTYAPCEA